MSITCRCDDCGRRFPLARRSRCSCGEPLWIETDPDGFDWNEASNQEGLWRYGELLPVDPPAGLGAEAGGTPTTRTSSLDDAGCRVYVKDEGRNPTGSFKDRGTAVGVAAALERGVEAVGTVSHGNMATSVAAHAASVDLPCAILVPADIPRDRLATIARFEPTIVTVRGSYGQLYDDAVALGDSLGIEFLNSDAPLRVEGQKTTAIEICHRFAPDVPDAIVLPVSSGGHASGVWKAFRELATADVVESVPRLYLVQAGACAPIASAFDRGAEAVTPIDPGETVAYSIANPDPPSGNRALAAARETGGAVVAVADEEIVDAQRTLATRAGRSVEAASAVTLAGIRTLTERSEIGANEDVVAVLTGRGFGESTDASADTRGIPIDELEDTLVEWIDDHTRRELREGR